MLKAWKSPKEMKMVIGMVDEAIDATRIGSSSITTIITAIMAMRSSSKKLVTLSLTTFGWSVIFVILTSCGSSFSKLLSILLIFEPISVMLRPCFISTLSTKHFFELVVIIDVSGAYSRLTSPTSRRRTTSPVGDV